MKQRRFIDYENFKVQTSGIKTNLWHKNFLQHDKLMHKELPVPFSKKKTRYRLCKLGITILSDFLIFKSHPFFHSKCCNL